MSNRRRQRRSGRRDRRAASPVLSIPFRTLRNRQPPLELASAEQVEELHEASMQILEEVGLRFLDDEALQIWEQAGARVDRSIHHVWLPRELVLEAVGKAPSSFTWQARNPEKNVLIGENAIAFAPHSGMAYAANLDMGRRRGTYEDFQNFLKLAQMTNNLHFAGSELVAPQEIPSSIRHLKRVYSAFVLTDKAGRDAAHGRVITQDNIEMAKIVFGDELTGGPVTGGVVNVNSPLLYDTRMLGGLITYARAGQVTIITPFLMIGAMSPITLPAALAQQNAEALAGVALAQLVNPGAPVVYGGFTTNVDMRSGSPAFGTPEGAKAIIIGAQMARRYGLPYRSSGSLNTSKVPDAQASYESMWTIWPAVMAHTNFVHHSVGWLESGLTASYEKFIIDAEGLGMFYNFLQEFSITDETLALDMIAEVGPGGHHFGTTHTLERFETAFHETFLSDRLGYEPWLAAGGLDTAKRANKIWKNLLEEYEPPPLDPAVKEALEEYITRRERDLAGANLYE